MSNRTIFVVLLVASLLGSGTVVAQPILDLSIDGHLTDTELVVTVHRTNTGFGLGGLSYDLQFSEPLDFTREYSDHGWVAGDGLWDNSIPTDGTPVVGLTSARFDTVADPAGSEFPEDSSGTVEVLTFTNVALTPVRWVFIDLLAPQASDGSARDLETTLGGTINVIPGEDVPDGHTFGIIVPEPASLMLLMLGGLIAAASRQRLYGSH